MTDKQTLLDLAERVEAGDATHKELRNAFPDIEGYFPYPADALDGSLDAAKALHDAVLPGWDFDIVSIDNEHQVDVGPCGTLRSYSGDAPTLAASWEAAILRAKASQ